MSIDVVYTWVNHEDPDWRAQYERATTGLARSLAVHETSNNSSRFHNREELFYSIKSVRKYAPWARNIYVVTNCSLPVSLQGDPCVFRVDHEEVFLDPSVLPTFNSHAIEANLHRIPGLSEKFIYFNDDVFLSDHVMPLDFFTADGRPYIFPSKHDIPYIGTSDLLPVDHAALNTGKLLQRDFGYRPLKKLHHAPFPLLKSTLFEIEERYRELLLNTASHKFREESDIPLATTFHAYYAQAKGFALPGHLKSRYIDIGDPLFVLLINPFSPLRRGKYQSFCLNEVRNIQYLHSLRDYIVKRFLVAMFDA